MYSRSDRRKTEMSKNKSLKILHQIASKDPQIFKNFQKGRGVPLPLDFSPGRRSLNSCFPSVMLKYPATIPEFDKS